MVDQLAAAMVVLKADQLVCEKVDCWAASLALLMAGM